MKRKTMTTLKYPTTAAIIKIQSKVATWIVFIVVIVAEIKRISEENLKNNNNNNKKKNSNLFLDNLSEKVKNLEHLFVLP